MVGGVLLYQILLTSPFCELRVPPYSEAILPSVSATRRIP